MLRLESYKVKDEEDTYKRLVRCRNLLSKTEEIQRLSCLHIDYSCMHLLLHIIE